MALQRKTPMRSGGPLKNTSPLGRGKGLSGGGGLKQSKPLQRKTPMPRSTAPTTGPQGGPSSTTPISRTPMKRKPVDVEKVRQQQARAREKRAAQPPKKRTRPAVSAEETQCRAIVATRSGGICERCGRGAAGLEKAHRVGRGQGGAWSPENIIDLCHDCHHHDHMHPAEAYATGLHLRSYQDPASEPVLWRKDGREGWALLSRDGSWSWTTPPTDR